MDVVTELRRMHSQLAQCGGEGTPLCTRCEAAAEIERLRAQVAELLPLATELARLRYYENKQGDRFQDRQRAEQYATIINRIETGEFQ